MTTNRTPGRAGEREPGLGQGDQLQLSDAARLRQQPFPGELPLDPRPEVGNVACILCGSGPAEFVAHYSPPEVPGVTTKYGLCTACATTLTPPQEAARINQAIRQELETDAARFRLQHNLHRCAS